MNVYLTKPEQEMIIQAIREYNLGIMDNLNAEWIQNDKTKKEKLSRDVDICEKILNKMGVRW